MFFIIGCMIISPFMGILMIDYIIDKKKKETLLNHILNNTIVFEKIWITEKDGDGYQRLEVLVKDDKGKMKNKTLALHFDIKKTCDLLSKNNILFSGKSENTVLRPRSKMDMNEYLDNHDKNELYINQIFKK